MKWEADCDMIFPPHMPLTVFHSVSNWTARQYSSSISSTVTWYFVYGGSEKRMVQSTTTPPGGLQQELIMHFTTVRLIYPNEQAALYTSL